jgi:transcriptional regulator with XRE-family HTH domain
MTTVSSADTETETRHVTIDQIVAMNMRYWRRSAGMTQEDLGDRLGWSAANISAAERSAEEGRDRRRFDADTLTALALTLGVPLHAFFFPPGDDGAGKRYVFTPPPEYGGDEAGMRDLFELVVMPDSDSRTPALQDYRYRFEVAAIQYLDEKWAKFVGHLVRGVESPEERAVRAAHLRMRKAELLKTAGELDALANAIDPERDSDD